MLYRPASRFPPACRRRESPTRASASVDGFSWPLRSTRTAWPCSIPRSVRPPSGQCPVAELLHRCRIGFETIGDDSLGTAMTLQRLPHEGEYRRFIPFPGDKAFQNFAFVIDGAPQIDHLAIHLHVRHRQCLKPRMRFTRRFRISAANIGPKRFHQSRNVS